MLRKRLFIGCFLALLLVPRGVLSGEKGAFSGKRAATEDVLIGKTAPAKSAIISSVQSGLIAEMPVKEGDFVRSGQVVVQLESDLQRAALAITKSKAESKIEIQAAKTRFEETQRKYDRLKNLINEAAASKDEFADATSRLILARRELELAQFENAQALRQLRFDEVRLNERTLTSPIDGYVVEQFKQRGEAVDQIEPVLHVVQIDPLHIQLDCPLEKHGKIHVGDQADVRLGKDRGPLREGKVIFLSKLGNPGSHTFRMKIEVPNPQHDWIAGMKVWVTLKDRQVVKEDSAPRAPLLPTATEGR